MVRCVQLFIFQVFLLYSNNVMFELASCEGLLHTFLPHNSCPVDRISKVDRVCDAVRTTLETAGHNK